MHQGSYTAHILIVGSPPRVYPSMVKKFDSEEHRLPARPASRKLPYQKPTFRHEGVFETMALACGKISSTQSACHSNLKTS